MKPLSKGDPCRVRRHTGKTSDAIYLRQHEVYGMKVKKTYVVEVDGIKI